MSLLAFYNIDPKEADILKEDGKIAVVRSNQKTHILFDPSFIGTERDEIEAVIQISEFLASLPSKELRDMAWTDDLKEEWDYSNCRARYISRFFLLINLAMNTDTAKQPKNKISRELCLLAAFRLRSLWELAKESLSLKDAVDTFCKILKEETDSRFEAILSLDFIQVSNNELKKIWESYSGLEELNPYNSQELTEFLLTLPPKLKKNALIRAHLRAYDSHCIELNRFHAEILGKRSEKGRIAKSYQWKNGNRYTLGKDNKPTK